MLWAHAQGFTSISVPGASTRLMSRSSSPDFNSDFNPASVAQLSTMLGGGQRMAERTGGFGHMPRSYVSFSTRAK